jgi:hypothetical protein
LSEPVVHGVQDSGYVFRFEAAGYPPHLTRVVRADEASVGFEISLNPANDIEVAALTPNEGVAGGAQVAFLMPGIDPPNLIPAVFLEHQVLSRLGMDEPDAQVGANDLEARA